MYELLVNFSKWLESTWWGVGVRRSVMDRLRRIVPRGQGYAPVMLPALR